MDFKKAWEEMKDKLIEKCDHRSDRLSVGIKYEFPALKEETERELQVLYEIKDAMDMIEVEQSKGAIPSLIEIKNRQELTEIYNALCSLNVSIRNKQKKRAKFIQKLIKKFEPIIKRG